MSSMMVEVNGVPIRQHQLLPGIHLAGRNPAHTIVLDDDTVSDRHCELQVKKNGRIRVRDLGSTNGTWVNGERVTERDLAPGDVIRLGLIQIRLLRQTTDSVASTAAQAESAMAGDSPTTFWSQIPSALRFPFQAGILYPMVLLLILAQAYRLLPAPFQVVGMLVGLAAAFYLFTICRMIIETAIDGMDELPTLMHALVDFERVREMFMQYLLLAFICMGLPGAANWIPGVPGWVSPVLSIGMAIYFSMAFLALIVTQTLVGLNPSFTMPSILSAPLPCVTASLPIMILLGLTFGTALPNTSATGFHGWPLVVGTLVAALSLYLLIIWARLLGLFYRWYQDRLQWG
jgi:hypothetical protein